MILSFGELFIAERSFLLYFFFNTLHELKIKLAETHDLNLWARGGMIAAKIKYYETPQLGISGMEARRYHE